MFCPICGHQIADDASACPSCGAVMTGNLPADAQTAPAQSAAQDSGAPLPPVPPVPKAKSRSALISGIVAISAAFVVVVVLLLSGVFSGPRDMVGSWNLSEVHGSGGTYYPVLSYTGYKDGTATIRYGDYFDVTGRLEEIGECDGGTVYELTDLDYDVDDIGGVTLDSVMIEVPNGGNDSLKGMWKLQYSATVGSSTRYRSYWCDFLGGGDMDFGAGGPTEDIFAEDWEPVDIESYGTDFDDEGWTWEEYPPQNTDSLKAYWITQGEDEGSTWYAVALTK